MPKKIGRIVLSILLIALLVVSVIFVTRSKGKNEESGTITVIVNNIDNEIVSTKRISFSESDNLYILIKKEYNVISDDTEFGHYLKGISDDSFSIETDGYESFLWFELFHLKSDVSYSESIDLNDYNEIQVNTGIDSISLIDNMIFAINERDSTHTTSINNNNIEINNKISKINNIWRNVIIFISVIFVLFLMIYLPLSIKSDKSKMTVKRLAILSIMTVILFVQEELLSFIPNVQLTFLLLALYVSVFGIKDTILIIVVHVLLDNMIMGSLTPLVMIPMFLGYIIYALLINMVKGKKLIWIIINSCIGVLIYAFMFIIANSLFLNIDMKIYIIADIPFDIILILTSILTIYTLYRPLEKVLMRELYKDTNI